MGLEDDTCPQCGSVNAEIEEKANTVEAGAMHDSAKESPAPEMHDYANQTFLPEPVEEIDGHTIALHEWRAFEQFCLTGSIAEAAQAGGVSPSTIFRWRHEVWWRSLIEQHLRFHQERFAAMIASRADEVAEGLLEVARGDDKSDETASARVQAAKVFAELGREPLINRRPDVRIQHNTFNSPGTLNIDKVAELSRLPGGHERILEIISGSVAPPKEVMD